MLYLAEFYLPDANLADVARRARAATQSAGDVSLVEVILVPADENCFALFDAVTADAVVAAGARAGMTFDRVVEARTASAI
ncbi:MAG TPA: hypothetical protein VFQ71_10205 [Gaiellales bacterium]|nr:hypothetical protein [Gaiellales bacterium]